MLLLALSLAVADPPEFDRNAPTVTVREQADVEVYLKQIDDKLPAVRMGSGRILDQAAYTNLAGFTLEVRSTATDRKRPFRLWSDDTGATLVDDLGNSYVRVRPENRLHRFAYEFGDARLDSQTTGGDRVVFERPVPAAKWVKLTLPGKNLGLSEPFVFQLPADNGTVYAVPPRKERPAPAPPPPAPEPAKPKKPEPKPATRTLYPVSKKLPMAASPAILKEYEEYRYDAKRVAALVAEKKLVILTEATEAVVPKQFERDQVIQAILQDGPMRNRLLYCRREHLTPPKGEKR